MWLGLFVLQSSAKNIKLHVLINIYRDAAELRALQESVVGVQSLLSESNVKVFQVRQMTNVVDHEESLVQDCVEVHMQHIQQGLSRCGNLTAFMETTVEK